MRGGARATPWRAYCSARSYSTLQIERGQKDFAILHWLTEPASQRTDATAAASTPAPDASAPLVPAVGFLGRAWPLRALFYVLAHTQ